MRLSLFETLTWERLSQHLTQPSTKAVPATTRPDKGHALLRNAEAKGSETPPDLAWDSGRVADSPASCMHPRTAYHKQVSQHRVKKVFQTSIQALGLPQQGGRLLSSQSASDSPHPVACPLHVSYLALRQPPTVVAIDPQYMAFQTIGKKTEISPPAKAHNTASCWPVTCSLPWRHPQFLAHIAACDPCYSLREASITQIDSTNQPSYNSCEFIICLKYASPSAEPSDTTAPPSGA